MKNISGENELPEGLLSYEEDCEEGDEAVESGEEIGVDGCLLLFGVQFMACDFER